MIPMKWVVLKLLIVCFAGNNYAQLKQEKSDYREPAIAMMYHHPELAEAHAKQIIHDYVPDPNTLEIVYCKAKYYVYYKAYVVNCSFTTDDAYGVNRGYAIQVKIRILPDDNGNPNYDVFDLKEL